MINLLPPDIKQEIIYSKRNSVLLHYTVLVGAVMIILAGALMAARLYLNSQIDSVSLQIQEKEAQIAKYKDLESTAKTLNARIVSIQKIQKDQAKFSVLLDDLAKNIPQGTAITSLTLTGNDKAPVQIKVKAVDYKTATSVREGISKSARISAADIESIQGPEGQNSDGTYTVTVSFAFNQGQAK